jgi:hypothetical protein
VDLGLRRWMALFFRFWFKVWCGGDVFAPIKSPHPPTSTPFWRLRREACGSGLVLQDFWLGDLHGASSAVIPSSSPPGLIWSS